MEKVFCFFFLYLLNVLRPVGVASRSRNMRLTKVKIFQVPTVKDHIIPFCFLFSEANKEILVDVWCLRDMVKLSMHDLHLICMYVCGLTVATNRRLRTSQRYNMTIDIYFN